MTTSPYYQNTSFGLASRLSLKMREQIFAKFMSTMKPVEKDLILDVGVTSDSTRPESNFFERLYPFPERITACGTEDASHLPNFIKVRPGRPLPFRNGQFDIAFSNATLEHAGYLNSQWFFVSEMMRVSKSFFIATPNRWFPVEFHTCLPFLHWLPRKTHRKILRLLGYDYWSEEENLRLLDIRDLKRLLKYDNLENTTRTDSVKLIGMATNIILYKP